MPCNGPALQSAVAAANTAGGGTLNLTAGCTYTLTTPDDGENGLAVITTPVRINGNRATIARSSATNFRFFQVEGSGNLTLDTLTLSNGRAREGGAIHISDSARLTLSASTLTGNTARLEGGGAIIITSSEATAMISNSTLSNNTATDSGGGGLSNVGGTVTFSGGAVTGNHAGVGGGISNSRGSVTLNSTRIQGNDATSDFGTTFGGGVVNEDGTMTLIGSHVLNNTASGLDAALGGGVWSAGFFAKLNISNSVILGNSATGGDSFGGGIYSDGTTALNGTVVLSNRVVGSDLADAGGIYRLDGTVTLTATAVANNQPSNCGNPSTVAGCS
ncbi:hypothetical protein [Pseudonocardia yunnanensis]|uniref:Right-handed parallel beta-helix repeat-containing protein n=1 Tax=Pseudonocardia yunnanensis TaxID=58107 RepID=A0ABW4F9T3_9PSEU